MKKIKFFIVILAIASQVACSQDSSSTREVEAFKTEIAKPNVVLLDVRTPEEYSAGHLQGAVNIDFRSPEFGLKLDSLNHDKQYELYCHSGKRSGESVKMMEEKGFRNVHHLKGGISAWEEKGNPTVK